MTLHREGFKIIFYTLLISTGIVLTMEYLAAGTWIAKAVEILCLIFFVLVVQFFRNPSRTTPKDANAIIAPADGKVVVIEEVEETEYLKTKCRQISIFMSPINVHVNRFPVSGEVKYSKYHPGKYLVAWHPKSSTENERTTVVVQHEKGEVLFRQIAGALAKRIVNYAKPGHKAIAGQEFGFIKFGSRVDVYIPLSAKVNVQLNQKTIGGETIIASWT